ncbi:hypothetical protein PIB30_078361 [Stylosanthes scabra]|uniref:Uncharacterized protein n=1 Tax=Stylosanthes scabra TaxID=79078 RepID=A0ABU6WSE9_9FABA|nr:hypothetical protein [Stylosanthes scabra]
MTCPCGIGAENHAQCRPPPPRHSPYSIPQPLPAAQMISSLWATQSWPYSPRIGPRGWSVTLPPVTRELELFGPSLRGDFSDRGNDDFYWALRGCGFLSFCNRPINYSAPKDPKACLRRLGRLNRLFSAFSFLLSFFFEFLCFSLIFLQPWWTALLSLTLPSQVSFSAGLFISEMEKKKSYQNDRNPRVLSPAERELYGWIDAEVFTQSSVINPDHLPELCYEMRLTQDLASERDYILEAVGPSDREVLTRCRVAANQLHLNGWGFLRNFERVCLHFGFHPSWRTFLYTYQLHAPPPGNGFLSFCAYQGRRLFDAFEESIQ